MTTARAAARTVGLLATLLVAPLLASPAAGQAAGDDPLRGAASLGWSEGVDTAPVRVVEFSDLSCPYCASFHEGTRASLREEFVAEGQVHWITVSYVSGQYRHSEAAAIGAECAGRQGRYEAFSAGMLARQASWVRGAASGVEAAVSAVAGQLELDAPAFDACLDDPTVRARLEAVLDMAREAGVRGTPTWFVDGFPVMGDLPTPYARSFIVERLRTP